MLDHQVIAAIATAPADGGIGIIRISGEGSIELADQIFQGKRTLASLPSYHLVYGKIISDETVLDEVLVSVMRSPKSYTTEDVVEINCHGGLYIQKKILNLLFSIGARPAKPGEFTMRAFLNGRIDLSQAESVMDLIEADNDFALKSAIQQLSGSFSEVIQNIRKKLLYEIAFIESALDDPEHFSLDHHKEDFSKFLSATIERIDTLYQSSEDGSVLKHGIPTALIGKVNVGKSSLLNTLSGRDKSIVTNIPGTTRDMIEETVRLGELSLKLIDTAGIRLADDAIEKIGIERSLQQIDLASLILFIIDASEDFSKEDEDLLKKIENKKAVICLNKSDLFIKTSPDFLRKKTKHPIILVSAKEHEGLAELKKSIEELCLHSRPMSQEFYITKERHRHLLKKALDSLHMVEESIRNGMTEDMYTIDLTDAYTFLGHIIGEEIEDDVAETIFSEFCIGK